MHIQDSKDWAKSSQSTPGLQMHPWRKNELWEREAQQGTVLETTAQQKESIFVPSPCQPGFPREAGFNHLPSQRAKATQPNDKGLILYLSTSPCHDDPRKDVSKEHKGRRGDKLVFSPTVGFRQKQERFQDFRFQAQEISC